MRRAQENVAPWKRSSFGSFDAQRADTAGATRLTVCLVECLRWDRRVRDEIERLLQEAVSGYNRNPPGTGKEFSLIHDWNVVYLDVDAFGEIPGAHADLRAADLIIADVCNNHPGYLFGVSYALCMAKEEKKSAMIVRPSYIDIGRSAVPVFDYTTTQEVEFEQRFEQQLASELSAGVRRKIEVQRGRTVYGVESPEIVDVPTTPKQIDWLATLARAVLDVPGGRFLLGPVMNIRKTPESLARNAQIDHIARSEQPITSDALLQILGGAPDGSTRMLARTLAELINASRGGGIADSHIADARQRIMLLPLAAPSDLVAQELNRLFASPELVAVLQRCAIDSGVPPFEERGGAFVERLVDELPQQPPDVVRRFFRFVADQADSELVTYIVNSLETGAAMIS